MEKWRKFDDNDNRCFAGAVGEEKVILDFEMPANVARDLLSKAGFDDEFVNETLEGSKSENNPENIVLTAIYATDGADDEYYVSLEFCGYAGLLIGDSKDVVLSKINSGAYDFVVTSSL